LPNYFAAPLLAVIVIIALGQELRGDDAAGLAAVRCWQEVFPAQGHASGVRIELAGLAGLSLLDLLQGAEAAILVDAVQSGAPAGKLHLIRASDLAQGTLRSGSVHGFGVLEALALGQALAASGSFSVPSPERIMIVGIEAGCLDLGEELSPEVQAALPAAARLIQEQLLAFQEQSG
jgi:hydrogenase maturation protease